MLHVCVSQNKTKGEGPTCVCCTYMCVCLASEGESDPWVCACVVHVPRCLTSQNDLAYKIGHNSQPSFILHETETLKERKRKKREKREEGRG